MARKKKAKAEKENSERWLLTYSDLITLLMIFFIILYAMSTTDARKFQDLSGALKEAFNNGNFQLVTVGGSPGNPKAMSGVTPTEKQTYKHISAELTKVTKEFGLKQNIVHVGISREGIVVTLSGSLLFYPGDVELRPQSYVLLKSIGQLTRGLPNRIRVEGNTDNQSTSTSLYTSNWALSALRSVSIVTYLSSQGVNPAHLEAEGLGQYHPIASNATPEGRAKNRRADIVILYP
jgi:chemotaxis protein MotB